MEENRYTKDDLKKTEKFKKRADALMALLKDGEEYSVEEAEEIIESFMKGRV